MLPAFWVVVDKMTVHSFGEGEKMLEVPSNINFCFYQYLFVTSICKWCKLHLSYRQDLCSSKQKGILVSSVAQQSSVFQNGSLQ